jgi:hypothetical protein
MKHIALLVAILMVASVAQAEYMRAFKEQALGGDAKRVENGYMYQVDIQDAMIDYTDNTYTYGQGPRVNGGASWVHDLGTYEPWGVFDRKILVGVEDLTTLLPVSSSLIKEAKLLISRSNWWSSGEIVNGYAVTTQWMWPTIADDEGYDTGLGTEEDPVIGGVSMNYAYDDGVNTMDWAGNFSPATPVMFSSANYDVTLSGQFATDGGGDTRRYTMDITDIVKSWYDEANNGMVLMLDPESGGDPNPYWEPSESTDPLDPADTSLRYWETGISSALAIEITLIPEPATLGLLAIGGLAALIRRKRS